jgi:hypothetical protein
MLLPVSSYALGGPGEGVGGKDDVSNNSYQTPGTSIAKQKPGTATMNAEDRKVFNYIQDVTLAVRRLIEEHQYNLAQQYCSRMTSMLDKSKMSSNMRNKLTASIHRYELASIYSLQAEYQKAANAIRTAIKFDKNEQDMEKLLKIQEKVGSQRELLNVTKQHQNDLTKLQEQKSAYLNQKLAILRQYNTSKALTDVDLKNIQKELKAITAKLGQVNENIEATQSRYQKSFQRFWNQGVFLTEKQKKEVNKLAEARKKLQADNYRKIRNITKKLSEISQNTQITWEGLKDNFKNLMGLQEEIYSMRKELLAISQNAPLNKKQYSAAKELRVALAKAMREAEEFMQGIEKAFVNAKTFAKLNFKEKLEFVKMFAKVWRQDKEFNSMKPSLEDIYSKIFDNQIISVDDPTPLPKPVPEQPEPKPEPAPKPKPAPQPQRDPQPAPQADPNRQTIKGRGMVLWYGNAWVISFENRFYEPVNFPALYKVNKLPVDFSGYRGFPPMERKFAKERTMVFPYITLTYIDSPQLPDSPLNNRGGQTATASEVIEENIDNQDQPSNLMNAF